MSYTPHLKRGGELYHFRTKGSRNGYSKDPNYRPVGQRATGKLVNGRYVYDIQPKKPVTLASRIKTAGSNAGNWLRDRGSEAKKAAGKVGNFVTGKEATKKLSDASFNYLKKSVPSLNRKTNRSNSYEADKLANNAKFNRTVAKEARETAGNLSIFNLSGRRKSMKRAQEADETARKLQKASDETRQKANQVYREQKEEERKAYTDAKNAEREYDKTLPGRIGKGLETLDKKYDSARKSAGDWLNDRKEDLSKTASNVAKSADKARKNAGNWLKDRGEDLSKAAGNAKKAAGDLADKAGKAVNEARETIDKTVDDVVKTGGKNLKNVSKRAKDFVDYNITGEGQKRDRAKAESDRRDAIDSAERKLSTVKTAKEREKGIRDLVKAAGDNASPEDTRAGHFLERMKNNLEKIDRIESDIKKGRLSGKALERAKKDLSEARIDNELSVGEFYKNKNASGKWGPMYEYENGQKQLNRKNINPDKTPDNVSQQEWDRYVAENYGHYPNRGRRSKKNK